MRIQISEVLATPDAEMVLRVLELSLREVSIEVERNSGQITVRGLGPSQRTMNRNDIALVEVASENQNTVIRADITYQASALLGGAPQDELVRAKLDRVIDRVKMEIGTRSVRVEAGTSFSTPKREPVNAERSFAPEAVVEPEQLIDRLDVAGTTVDAESVREVGRVDSPEPDGIAAAAIAAVALSFADETVPEEKPAEVLISSTSEKHVDSPMFQAFHSEEAKPPKRWGLLATVACMLGAVGLFLAWPYLVGLVHERLNPSATVAEGSVVEVTPEATKLPADNAPIELSDAAARSAAIHNEIDPKVWLESWADAMRGQDAGAQALFYADPVEHYALKSNVSNADVWLDKKNAIQNRPKVWTVNLEDVVIEPRPDDSLRVRLTKHYTSSQVEGGRVSEQRIHSQLKLRKIDGQWKITSEQNFAPARD